MSEKDIVGTTEVSKKNSVMGPRYWRQSFYLFMSVACLGAAAFFFDKGGVEVMSWICAGLALVAALWGVSKL